MGCLLSLQGMISPTRVIARDEVPKQSQLRFFVPKAFGTQNDRIRRPCNDGYTNLLKQPIKRKEVIV